MPEPTPAPEPLALLSLREKIAAFWLKLKLLLTGQLAYLDPTTGDLHDPGSVARLAVIVLVAALGVLLVLSLAGTLTKLVAIVAAVAAVVAGIMLAVKAYRTPSA